MISNVQVKATSVSYKGLRSQNEDQFDINTSNSPNLYAIYDGHGGEEVSSFLKTNLPKHFKNQSLPIKKKNVYNIFDNLQKELITKNKKIAEEVGSTCLCVLQDKNKLNIINCGDCRCIISTNKKAQQITVDHKPNELNERKRLLKIKGKEKLYLDEDIWRIGPLSVSRSFGDTDTAPYIIQKPDIFTHTITKNDDFMVIACDGLWDVMSNQEVVNFVRNNPSNTVRKLGSEALRKGTTDNISIILLEFNHPLMVNNNTTKQSAGSKTVSRKSVKQSTDSKTVKQSTGSKTVKQSASSKTAKQSAGSKTAKQSTASKTVKQSAGSKTAKQSAGSKTAKQSAGSKTGRIRSKK